MEAKAEKKKEWTEITKMADVGSNQKSERFELKGGDVKVTWTAKAESRTSWLAVRLREADTGKMVDGHTGGPKQEKGEWITYNVKPGIYYLQIPNSDMDYKVTVYELR